MHRLVPRRWIRGTMGLFSLKRRSIATSEASPAADEVAAYRAEPEPEPRSEPGPEPGARQGTRQEPRQGELQRVGNIVCLAEESWIPAAPAQIARAFLAYLARPEFADIHGRDVTSLALASLFDHFLAETDKPGVPWHPVAVEVGKLVDWRRVRFTVDGRRMSARCYRIGGRPKPARPRLVSRRSESAAAGA